MWARIVFSSAGKPPQELKSGADVKKVISQTPNAIGYIEKSEVDDSVKVIAVVE
jgi:ABC-type phosphate transport system substrate-binding protein